MSKEQGKNNPQFRDLRTIVEDLQEAFTTLEDRQKFVRNFRAKIYDGVVEALDIAQYFDLMDFQIKGRNGNCVRNLIVAVTPEVEAYLEEQKRKHTPLNATAEDFQSGRLDFFELVAKQKKIRDDVAVVHKPRGRPKKVKTPTPV